MSLLSNVEARLAFTNPGEVLPDLTKALILQLDAELQAFKDEINARLAKAEDSGASCVKTPTKVRADEYRPTSQTILQSAPMPVPV